MSIIIPQALITITSLFSTQSITQLEPLRIGALIVADNQRESTATILPTGSIFSTNDIYILERGQPAELLFEGYGARVQLNISDFTVDEKLINSYISEYFIIKKLIYNKVIFTDYHGTALLKVGAQIATTGDNKDYKDTIYDTSISLTIDF